MHDKSSLCDLSFDDWILQGWKSYLSDLEQADMIRAGVISDIDGGKSAATLEYVDNSEEIDKLVDALNNKSVLNQSGFSLKSWSVQ